MKQFYSIASKGCFRFFCYCLLGFVVSCAEAVRESDQGQAAESKSVLKSGGTDEQGKNISYYLFSFDSNPATQSSRCWYYKEAPANMNPLRALSTAVMLTKRELPDSAIQAGFAIGATVNSGLAVLYAGLAAPACPATPTVVGGFICFLSVSAIYGSLGDAKTNIEAGVGARQASVDRKIVWNDQAKILRIKEAIVNSKSSQSGNNCWPSNKVIDFVRSQKKQ